LEEKFDPYAAEWKTFATSQNFNLIEKCLKLSQLLEYPELDISEHIKKINQIGKSLKVSLNNTKSATYRISMLNEYFFQKCGFHGDIEDYYNPKNNFLNAVLEKKSGLAIILSILYAEIAKYVDLDLRIVGFPSHVVVKYKEEMILDPFDGGKLLSKEDLEKILYQNYGQEVKMIPEYLNEITSEQILIRITRNLKNSYTQSFAYDMALRCANMILSLTPNSPEEIRDVGILQERLLNYENSLVMLNRYLEASPNAEDVDFILELIKSIKDKINQ